MTKNSLLDVPYRLYRICGLLPRGEFSNYRFSKKGRRHFSIFPGNFVFRGDAFRRFISNSHVRGTLRGEVLFRGISFFRDEEYSWERTTTIEFSMFLFFIRDIPEFLCLKGWEFFPIVPRVLSNYAKPQGRSATCTRKDSFRYSEKSYTNTSSLLYPNLSPRVNRPPKKDRKEDSLPTG